MSVVPLTLTISLCLVFTFVLFFLREHSRRRFSGVESEALLPLADEIPRIGAMPANAQAAAVAPEKEHAHGHACRGNGTCSSCERRARRRAASAGTNA